jgi:hypothetical protein
MFPRLIKHIHGNHNQNTKRYMLKICYDLDHEIRINTQLQESHSMFLKGYSIIKRVC